jgi:hypothetical protein
VKDENQTRLGMDDYYRFGIEDGKPPRGHIKGGNPKQATREQAIRLIAEVKGNGVVKTGMTFGKNPMSPAHKNALFAAAELWNKLAAMEKDL